MILPIADVCCILFVVAQFSFFCFIVLNIVFDFSMLHKSFNGAFGPSVLASGQHFACFPKT